MGKNVVLVEDEIHIAEAIRFLLGREGWRVEMLANGATAVDVIRNVAPELVILDHPEPADPHADRARPEP